MKNYNCMSTLLAIIVLAFTTSCGKSLNADSPDKDIEFIITDGLSEKATATISIEDKINIDNGGVFVKRKIPHPI